jgi:cell wall-associated NlpC family hydrolase
MTEAAAAARQAAELCGAQAFHARISGPLDHALLGPLDPRLAAWRPDLADIDLAGRIAVPVYARPVQWTVVVGSAALQERPDDAAPMLSELLHGEGFALLDAADGWGWGYAMVDHYVGYVRLDGLAPADSGTAGEESRIGPGDGLVFVEPAIKSRVEAVLPAGAVVRWRSAAARFVELVSGGHAGGFVHRGHLMAPPADWVEVALQFVGAPYRWGGRTRAGVDCSGLVQAARLLAGHKARRDSDMQRADAPMGVAPGAARRGDLAFWPGHVGILLDADTLLHANAHWMRCVAEPLADVTARIGAAPEIRRPG